MDLRSKLLGPLAHCSLLACLPFKVGVGNAADSWRGHCCSRGGRSTAVRVRPATKGEAAEEDVVKEVSPEEVNSRRSCPEVNGGKVAEAEQNTVVVLAPTSLGPPVACVMTIRDVTERARTASQVWAAVERNGSKTGRRAEKTLKAFDKPVLFIGRSWAGGPESYDDGWLNAREVKRRLIRSRKRGHGGQRVAFDVPEMVARAASENRSRFFTLDDSEDEDCRMEEDSRGHSLAADPCKGADSSDQAEAAAPLDNQAIEEGPALGGPGDHDDSDFADVVKGLSTSKADLKVSAVRTRSVASPSSSSLSGGWERPSIAGIAQCSRQRVPKGAHMSGSWSDSCSDNNHFAVPLKFCNNNYLLQDSAAPVPDGRGPTDPGPGPKQPRRHGVLEDELAKAHAEAMEMALNRSDRSTPSSHRSSLASSEKMSHDILFIDVIPAAEDDEDEDVGRSGPSSAAADSMMSLKTTPAGTLSRTAAWPDEGVGQRDVESPWDHGAEGLEAVSKNLVSKTLSGLLDPSGGDEARSGSSEMIQGFIEELPDFETEAVPLIIIRPASSPDIHAEANREPVQPSSGTVGRGDGADKQGAKAMCYLQVPRKERWAKHPQLEARRPSSPRVLPIFGGGGRPSSLKPIGVKKILDQIDRRRHKMIRKETRRRRRT